MNTELEQIWKDFSVELKAFIVKRTNNSSCSDDILQNVFIKIHDNIDKVGQSKNMRQYLYAMVKNSINDHYRKNKYHLTSYEIPELSDPENTDKDIDLTELIAVSCIQPFIKTLDPKYQEALQLSEIENIPQTELAKKLNISYSGAKSRVQRGREKLKEQLLDCCHFEADAYGNLIEVKRKCC